MKAFLIAAVALCAGASVFGVALLPTPAAEATATAPAQYKIDPVHSSLVFKVRHMGITDVYGRFNEFSGGLSFDAENLAESKIAFSVEADSIDTANGKRDEHLRGPDFFNAVQFPRVTFASTSIEKDGDGYKVMGDLELMGKKLPVTAEVEMNGTAEGRGGVKLIGFEAEFEVKRSLWGMTYGVGGPLGDEISVTVSIQAAQG